MNMNIGDKLRLKNMYGDVVEHELVAVIPKVEELYPKVYANSWGVWVVFDGITKLFGREHGHACGKSLSSEEYLKTFATILTGPEAAEYVAAAREGRDAVWPKESDPWPHWWTRKDNPIEWLWEVSSDGAVVRHDKHEAENQEVAKHGDLIASEYGYRRIPAPEAAALLAKWEGERKGKEEPKFVPFSKYGVGEGGLDVMALPKTTDWGETMPFNKKLLFAFPQNGYDYDKERCADKLVPGRVYEAVRISVSQSSSWVELKDFPGEHWNTVNFADWPIVFPTPQPELPTAESVAKKFVNEWVKPYTGHDGDRISILDYHWANISDAGAMERRINSFRERASQIVAELIRTDRQARSGEVPESASSDGNVSSRHLQKELE